MTTTRTGEFDRNLVIMRQRTLTITTVTRTGWTQETTGEGSKAKHSGSMLQDEAGNGSSSWSFLLGRGWDMLAVSEAFNAKR